MNASTSPVHIVYLSYDGLTDPLGQSQILPYVVGLSKKGYSFSIISFEKNDSFTVHEQVRTICTENMVDWSPLKYHKKPPVLSTLFDIWILWQAVKKCYQKKKFLIVHCRSYITSLVGLRAKQKWGSKFIFDMRGFWADERIEGGLWNLKNPVYRLTYDFFKKKEALFIKQADHIVSLTHNAKNEMKSWGADPTQITVIPTCVDLDLFNPDKVRNEDQSTLRRKLGISEDDFVLLYLGSWGTWYLTNVMLSFFSALKAKKTRAKFLIVTTEAIDLTDYKEREAVVVTSSLRKDVPLHISIANASICFLSPSFSKKASSATKIGEIMAMNVPVIANTGWGDIDTMASNGAIVLSDLNDYNSTFQKLFSFQNKALRQYCVENLSLTISIERYGKIYRDLNENTKLQE